MAHKRVEARTLEALEQKIAGAKASIQRIKTLSVFGKDSQKAFVEFLQDAENAMAERRADLLRKLGLGKMGPDGLNAITWSAAQEEAYRSIKQMLTQPQLAIRYYEDELVALENERKSYAQHQVVA